MCKYNGAKIDICNALVACYKYESQNVGQLKYRLYKLRM